MGISFSDLFLIKFFFAEIIFCNVCRTIVAAYWFAYSSNILEIISYFLIYLKKLKIKKLQKQQSLWVIAFLDKNQLFNIKPN